MAELNTRIILRNDETAEWAESKKVLSKGELALEYQNDGTVKIKAGDGEHSFGDLAYVGSDVKPAQVYQVVEALSFDNEDDDIDIIESLIPEGTKVQNGDIAVIKRYVDANNTAISYTSYVYEDGVWQAMDGNYSASNVFLKNSITLAGNYSSIGNYSKGKVVNAGTSLEAMLMDMLSQRLQPSIKTNPSISVTLNEAGAKEVGTEVTPTFKTGSNDGAYTYEETTGVTFSGWSVKTSGRKTVHEGDELSEETASSTSGSFTKFVVDEDTDYKLTVTANGTAGTVAKDNLGADSNPVVQIAAKDGYSNNSSKITGYRAWFYGYKKGTDTLLDVNNLTSSDIRALTSSNGTIPATINAETMQQMFFAAPAGKITGVAVEGTNPVAPQTVLGPKTVKVEGANGFEAVDYDVYYISNATAAAGSQDYKITVTTAS